MPKVSVIVPVYKAEKYLRRCVDSILAQTLFDIEIILVNDCSPDNSVDIIKQYTENDSRVIMINHEKNQGPMMARYHGYSKATGKYITFVDGDDTLPPHALEQMVNEAERVKADVVSGKVKYIKDNGEQYDWINKLSHGTDKIAVFKSMLEGEFHHNLCSRLFTRAILQNFQYRNYNNLLNGEDGLLFYQIIDNSSLVSTIDVVVYEYWQNAQSSSQRKFSESQMDSYFFTCKEQYNIAKKYASLNSYAKQFAIRSIIQLYATGYSKKFVNKYIEKYNLQEIVNYISIWKLFPCKIALQYSIQKMLFPLIREVK